MNDWQVALQIQHIVKTLDWPNADSLFRSDSVIITPVSGAEVLKFHLVPMCLIGISNASPIGHRQEEIIEQGFDLVIIVAVGGDKSGQSSVVGKDRGTTGATGRGLLEYGDVLKTGIAFMTKTQGIEFSFIGASDTTISRLGNAGSVMSRNYSFVGRLTQQKTYDEGSAFRQTESGGTVTLTWAAFPNRFDREKFRVFRNTVEITTVGQGGNVELTLSGDFAVTVADSPGSGTFFYALFLVYNEPATVADINSDAVNVKVTV